MKNPVAKAWGCVGIMFTGGVLCMVSLAFLNNMTIAYLFMVLGALVFLGGMILHFVTVRCPHCGGYLGRCYGSKCPHCGSDYK